MAVRDSAPRETAPPVDERRLREALAQLDGMHRALTSLLGGPSGGDAGEAIRAAIAELPEARPAIRLLGGFSVEFNGRPVTLSAGGKSVAVLKFLAASGTQTVPRDRILDALWPEVPASVAASRLRSALHALRRMFADQGGVQGTRGGEVVAYDHGQYLLFPGTLLVTDVDLFEDAWARGQEYDRAGERGLAVASYERAERLYRGDFLEQDAYLDWTSVRREQLRDAYLTLLARLAHLYIERGEDMAAISCCHKLLRRDDCNEEAYRLLIAAHGRRGDRNAALRWYDICERELGRVLGVAPSEGTRAAREAVLSATGGTEPVRLATAG